MFFKQAGAIAAASWPGVSWAREIASPGITEVVPVPVAAAVAETKDIVLENKGAAAGYCRERASAKPDSQTERPRMPCGGYGCSNVHSHAMSTV